MSIVSSPSLFLIGKSCSSGTLSGFWKGEGRLIPKKSWHAKNKKRQRQLTKLMKILIRWRRGVYLQVQFHCSFPYFFFVFLYGHKKVIGGGNSVIIHFYNVNFNNIFAATKRGSLSPLPLMLRTCSFEIFSAFWGAILLEFWAWCLVLYLIGILYWVHSSWLLFLWYLQGSIRRYIIPNFSLRVISESLFIPFQIILHYFSNNFCNM